MRYFLSEANTVVIAQGLAQNLGMPNIRLQSILVQIASSSLVCYCLNRSFLKNIIIVIIHLFFLPVPRYYLELCIYTIPMMTIIIQSLLSWTRWRPRYWWHNMNTEETKLPSRSINNYYTQYIWSIDNLHIPILMRLSPLPLTSFYFIISISKATIFF